MSPFQLVHTNCLPVNVFNVLVNTWLGVLVVVVVVRVVSHAADVFALGQQTGVSQLFGSLTIGFHSTPLVKLVFLILYASFGTQNLNARKEILVCS